MCRNCYRLQVIRKALTEEEAEAEGKLMEAIVGHKLSHPNIVKTLASGSMRIKVQFFSMVIRSQPDQFLYFHAG